MLKRIRAIRQHDILSKKIKLEIIKIGNQALTLKIPQSELLD